MKKKRFVMLGLVAGLSVLSAVPAFAGEWKADTKGWWYQEDNSFYPVSTWKEINGKQYYFGADGYMLANTTTPDGYTVNADGEWTVKGVVQTNQASASNKAEIAEIRDIATLPAGMTIDAASNYIYGSKTVVAGDYQTNPVYKKSVYDSNGNLIWELPEGWELTDFVGGISVVTDQNKHKYLYDINKNMVADLGTDIYVQQFEEGVDPNGLVAVGYKVDNEKITLVGYGKQTGYFKKTYNRKDYPELKEATDILGPHNGMYKICKVTMTIMHEGYINQYGVRDEKILMNLTTLGDLVSSKNDVGGYDSYVRPIEKSKEFTNSGAYFESADRYGNEYILKDKTGAEKFRAGCVTPYTTMLSNGDGSFYIMNNDTFVAVPQGTTEGGSFHVYKISYK